MYRVLKLVFISSLLWSSLASAQICHGVLEKDSKGYERLASMEFPDGRRLQIIGQYHGLRGEALKIAELHAGDDYLEDVRKLVQKDDAQFALPFLREDIQHLRKAIQNGAQFVGTEMSPEGLKTWIVAAKSLRDRLVNFSANTGKSDPALISAAVLYSSGTAIKLSHDEPGLFRRAPLVGIESGVRGDLQWSHNPAMTRTFHEAYRALAGDPNLQEKFHMMAETIDVEVYPHFDAGDSVSHGHIVENYLRKYPRQYHRPLRDYLNAQIEFFKSLSHRDDYTAPNMIKQNRSGVILIGALHIAPLLRRLQKSCVEMMKLRPANATGLSLPQSFR